MLDIVDNPDGSYMPSDWFQDNGPADDDPNNWMGNAGGNPEDVDYGNITFGGNGASSNPKTGGITGYGGGFSGIPGDWTRPTLDMIKAYGRSRGVEMTDQQAGYWVQQWPNLMRETPNDPSYALMRLEKADEWTAPGDRYMAGAASQNAMLDPWTKEFHYDDFKGIGDFTAPTMDEATNDQGYQTTLNEARKSMERSAASQGSLLTGGFLKDLDRFSQGMASQQYDKVYNRRAGEYQDRYGRAWQEWNTGRNNALQQYLTERDNFYANQDRPYDKLTGLLGLTLGATNNMNSLGAGLAGNAGNIVTGGANNVNNSTTGAANANAAAAVATGNNWNNALANGLGSVGSIYAGTRRRTGPR